MYGTPGLLFDRLPGLLGQGATDQADGTAPPDPNNPPKPRRGGVGGCFVFGTAYHGPDGKADLGLEPVGGNKEREEGEMEKDPNKGFDMFNDALEAILHHPEEPDGLAVASCLDMVSFGLDHAEESKLSGEGRDHYLFLRQIMDAREAQLAELEAAGNKEGQARFPLPPQDVVKLSFAVLAMRDFCSDMADGFI